MAIIQVTGTVFVGPQSSGSGVFPAGSVNTPFETTPNPKISQVSSQNELRVQSPSAFQQLSGLGAGWTVTKADTLYLRSDAPVILRLTQANPSGPPTVQTVAIQGLFISEFPQVNALILIEVQGSAGIEYVISGQQLSQDASQERTRGIIMGETLKQSFDRANPNTVADNLRSLGIGDIIRALPTFLRRKAPATVPTHPAGTEQALVLGDDAKAAVIHTAYGLAGAGTLGALAVVAGVPAAGQIAVAPNGDIVTALADAWTSLDVVYQPEKGDVFTFTGTVDPVTGIMPLPTSATLAGVVLLTSATALLGTATGTKVVAANGAAPAAGLANLSLAKSQVQFAVADGVTSATVTLVLVSALDVDALLEAPSTSM
jgi:hypothetical protein